MQTGKIVVWGAGGHARVVADCVRSAREFEIVGFLDDVNPGRRGEPFCGASILGGTDVLAGLLSAGVQHALVAFGDCAARLVAASRLAALGFEFPAVLHPSAVRAADVIVGGGSVALSGAIMNPGATVGAHVIVNTAASIDHDCRIEDGVHICPGVRLAGGVQIGRGAWIGIGSVVIDGLSIGAESIIGAGSVVVTDIPPRAIAFGAPARVRRTVQQ
jgi:UDP-N-acetylbacillosamine N-acetyltransferase